MKLNASFKNSEHKNWGNADNKYKIRGYDWHLPYVVDVDVTFCSLFCDYSVFIFWKPARYQIKLKISREWTEHNNNGSNDRRYAIWGLNGSYPMLLTLTDVLFFVLLSCLMF